MTFLYPDLLWLLLLLPTIYIIKKYRHKKTVLRFPNVQQFKAVSRSSLLPFKILAFLRYVVMTLIIIALARPQEIDVTTHSSADGIDIMLAVDISSSMMALDFYTEKDKNLVTRLDVAKNVLSEFVTKRKHDRIGLVAFAGGPYLVSPTTFNKEWIMKNIERLSIGMVEDGTAIGDAIAMSCSRLKTSNMKSKIVILMTDGVQNAGTLTPKIAAEAASALGIKVYVVGVGKSGIVHIGVPDKNGNIVRDAFGNPYIIESKSSIDEKVLQDVASIANGRYFRATNKAQLAEIYDIIDQLEKTEVKIDTLSSATDFFAMICVVAMILAIIERVLSNTKYRRLP